MDERVDTAVAELARRQHGVVEWGQLVALGLGRGGIEARVAAGRLHRLHVGVFAVGHTALTPTGRRLAAVLACGPGALLSHETAADHWGIRPSASARIHVTVPTTAGRRRPGIVVHRTRRLRPEDAASRDAVPVTSVARTLLDLTPRHGIPALRKMVERAMRRGLFDRAAALELVPGRSSRKLRAAIEQADPAAFRSGLESDFLALCRDHGVPRPEVNVWLGEFEVDFLWREHALVVEVDGWEHHRTRRSFEEDRRRDVALAGRGIRVLRFADTDVGPAAMLAVRRQLAVSGSGRPRR